MTERGKNNGGNGRRHTPIAVAVIGAFLGSSGSIAVVLNSPYAQSVTRPDPYTGTQAAALAQRVEHLEKELYDHTHNHPDITNEFDRRITRLETHIQIVIANQERILARMDERR